MSGRFVSWLAQELVNHELAPSKRVLSRWLPRRVISAMTHYVRASYDPVVTVPVYGSILSMPFSHDLPRILYREPNYSSNLGRVAVAVHRHFSKCSVIDVGANVGDSIALIAREVVCEALCVEGDRKYLQLLHRNLASIRGSYVVEEAYLGAADETVMGSVASSAGTAEIRMGEASDEIQLISFKTLLEKHPHFRAANLVKIDTDGFDCQIISSSVDVLADIRPTVFFEYDPHFFKSGEGDGYRVFAALRDAEYSHVIVWDNVGRVLRATELSDEDSLDQLDRYARNRHKAFYLDICAFHRTAADLYGQLAVAEFARVACNRPATVGTRHRHVDLHKERGKSQSASAL